MYITADKIVPLGSNLVQTYKTTSEFIVRNKLSKKPAQAAQKLKKLVECQNSICKDYDLDMKQDYSRGVVRLNLLEQCYTYNRDGHLPNHTLGGQYICQSYEVPVTASAKRYTQAVQQMLQKNTTELEKIEEEPSKFLFFSEEPPKILVFLNNIIKKIW